MAPDGSQVVVTKSEYRPAIRLDHPEAIRHAGAASAIIWTVRARRRTGLVVTKVTIWLLLTACGNGGGQLDSAPGTTASGPTGTTAAVSGTVTGGIVTGGIVTGGSSTIAPTTEPPPPPTRQVGPEIVDPPAAFGEFRLIRIMNQDPVAIARRLPFDRAGAGYYGRAEQPEYLVLVGSASSLVGDEKERILRAFLDGLSEGTTIDAASKVVVDVDEAHIECSSGTTRTSARVAFCLLDRARAVGIVYSIPTLGPSDVATAQRLTRLIAQRPLATTPTVPVTTG